MHTRPQVQRKENRTVSVSPTWLWQYISSLFINIRYLNICCAQRNVTLCMGSSHFRLSGSQLYIHTFISLFLYRYLFVLFQLVRRHFEFRQFFPKFVALLFTFLLSETQEIELVLRYHFGWDIIYFWGQINGMKNLILSVNSKTLTNPVLVWNSKFSFTFELISEVYNMINWLKTMVF